jgi:hypothetical protein
MTDKICEVCGIPATHKHMSIIGQIPFFVCKDHFENTFPFHDYGMMGLLDKNGHIVDLEFRRYQK